MTGIVVDALAALGALSIAFCVLVVWWGIARHRKSERAAGDEMALVNATKELKVPTDAEIVRAIDDWKKRFGQ